MLAVGLICLWKVPTFGQSLLASLLPGMISFEQPYVPTEVPVDPCQTTVAA